MFSANRELEPGHVLMTSTFSASRPMSLSVTLAEQAKATRVNFVPNSIPMMSGSSDCGKELLLVYFSSFDFSSGFSSGFSGIVGPLTFGRAVSTS